MSKSLLLPVFRFLCLLLGCLPIYSQIQAQCPPNNQTVLYVDAAITASGDGFSWGSAFKTLQEALEATDNCATINQIWVKKGTYYPSSYASCGDCYAEPRFQTFKLKNGVSIYGGFGGGETTLAARNIAANPTVLSGNIGAQGDAHDNVFHVLLAVNITSPTELDGLTVQEAYADQNFFNNNAYNNNGGGLYSTGSTLTLRQCTFLNNFSNGSGAILNGYTSHLTLDDCIFNANHSLNGGGAINSFLNSTLQLTNCLFTYNWDGTQGGALTMSIGALVNASNCTFYGNYTATNEQTGGAIFVENTCTVNVSNSIFRGNGTGTFGGEDPTLPGADILINGAGVLNLQNSATQTTQTCTGCLATPNTDVFFANSGSIKGEDNRYRTADDGLRLTPCSPAYNAGNNALVIVAANTDLKGADRIQYSTVDMGAYETTVTNYPTGIVYVDSAATGLKDGTSWANAFTSLEAGIQAARCNEDKVWVKKGTYYPTANPGGLFNGDNDPKNFAFRIFNKMAIYGGFSGTEATEADRNIAANPTILSGDIGVLGTATDNAYHVVVAINKTDLKPLDGFIIQDGYSDNGSTIKIDDQTSPKSSGGGIVAVSSNQVLVNNCIIKNNYALNGGGGVGGYTSSLVLDKCQLLTNTTDNAGGGLLNYGSYATLYNCVLQGNHASDAGAVGNLSNSHFDAYNTLFIKNTASYGAGAVENVSASNANFTSCTFYGNSSEGSDEQAVGAISTLDFVSNTYTNVYNSIFYKNSINTGNYSTMYSAVNADVNTATTLTLTNCIRQTSQPACTNCLVGYNIDPKFADSTNTAGADGLYNTADDGFKPTKSSPVINKGYNAAVSLLPSDFAGAPRLLDDYTDIGAYEQAAVCVASAILYVDSSRAVSGNGTAWGQAFKSFQEALDVANACPVVTQIWLAKGTYRPTTNPNGCSNCEGIYHNSFLVRDNLAIYGGFAGTETDIADRNWETNLTILSGDLADGDSPDYRANHVITTVNNVYETIFDGLTVSDGYAAGGIYTIGGQEIWGTDGGGMANANSQSIKINNCIFKNNRAYQSGGAIHNFKSYLIATHCQFLNNSTEEGYGGVSRNDGASNSQMINCVFSGNSAKACGAFANLGSSSLNISNSLFDSNFAAGLAGGIWSSYHSYLTVTNCTFSKNYSYYNGGGHAGAICISNDNNSALIANCVFSKNSFEGQDNTTLPNADIYNEGNSLTIRNSTLQTVLPCTNCLPAQNVELFFTNENNPAGADGKFATADDGLRLSIGSPAINKGDNASLNANYNTDLAGASRIQNTTIDMGAYETPSCYANSTVFVDASMPASGDGYSWGGAFKSLDEALGAAQNCPGIQEVWIAKGTYKPSTIPSGCSTCGNDSRNSTFVLRPGLSLYGSFKGDENYITDRDIVANPTILSGDIGQPGDNSDNCYHVLFNGWYNDQHTVIDGLTIRDGNANGASTMTINGNPAATSTGGGFYNPSNHDLVISNCKFIKNSVLEDGGGLYNLGGTQIISNTQFIDNYAAGTGAGLYNYYYNGNINNCVFSGNVSQYGGAVFNNYQCNTTYSNCLFTLNHAATSAGAFISLTECETNITNCTFYSNYITDNRTTLDKAGAIYLNARYPSTISNCIFYNNSYNGFGNGSVTTGEGSDIESVDQLTINNSIIQSALPCNNCQPVGTNPVFVNGNSPAGADQRFGTADDGLQLQLSSQGINKGNNAYVPPAITTDLIGNNRVIDASVDLGVYEFNACPASPVLYVNAAVSNSGDGLAWGTAFKTLQEAIDVTVSCNSVQQIWVAKGTYKPSAMPAGCVGCGTNPRNYAFYLRSGIGLYGGFAGTETDPTQRDIAANPTILSGDIGTLGDNTDNAYHVVITTPNAAYNRVDGFTIQDGNANNGTDYLTLNNDGYIFAESGAGIFDADNVNLTISNCLFTKNNALRYGGGMYHHSADNVLVEKCQFINNTAGNGGGGLYSYSSHNIQVQNCVFNNNSSSSQGGAIYNETTSYMTVINSLFTGNSASVLGGAISSYPQTELTTLNCTFYGNYVVNNSANGGAIYTSVATITNCLFNMNSYNGVGNGAITTGAGSDIYQQSTFLMQFSAPQSNLPCSNCLPANTNPLFVNENSPRGADQIFGTSDDGLKLKLGSTAINAGTNSPINTNLHELAGGERIQDAQVDIGAYENSVCPGYSKLYVNAAIPASGNGSTWASSFKTLQEAIEVAAGCGNIKEIWVAKGTYKPSAYPAGCTDCASSGDTRKYSFLLRNGIKWYGGFAGTENSVDERDLKANKSILSGDISDPDADTDNAYHIVLSLKNVDSSLIDGFTLLGGFATGGNNTTFGGEDFNNRYGGAFSSNLSQNVGIANCTFYANHADYSGGAIRNYKSDLWLSKCLFDINNSGSTGGAVYNYINATLKADKCIFYQNNSGQAGAIDLEYFAPATLTQCVVAYNYGNLKAGAVKVEDGSKLTAINSTFYNNYTYGGNGGGAVYIKNFGQPTYADIFNCIFKNNSNENLNVYNTPGADIYNESVAQNLQLRYSAIQVANANSSSFLNQVNQPVVLQNELNVLGADGVFGTTDDGLKPAIGSPTINAADNTALSADITTDFAGEARISAGRIDMGAYEFNSCPNYTIAYVDGDKATSGDGSSWAKAFKTLQEAIDVNASCTSVNQVWVKKGTYIPTSYPNGCVECQTEANPRKFSFLMQNNISFYGGFDGTESVISQRNIAANPTILSGDIGFANDSMDNCYHVIISDHNASSTIDGFTIKGGNANSTAVNASTSIKGTLFVNNEGGGLMAEYYGNLTVTNCTFENNFAGLLGGGIMATASIGGTMNVSKSFFINNTAYLNDQYSSGGAIRAEGYGRLNLDNTSFAGNFGSRAGAVDVNDFEVAHVNNCVFDRNGAVYLAGAIRVTLGSKLFANNSTFFANFTTDNSEGAGAILVEGNVLNPDTAYIKNSIFYKNVNDHLVGDNDLVPNSDVRIGTNGVYKVERSAMQNFNLSCCFDPNTNPLFVNQNNPAGADGEYGTADDGLALQSCSPFINKGGDELVEAGNTLDLTGITRIQGDAVELGAYEYPGTNNGNPNGGDFLAINGDNGQVSANVNQSATFLAIQSACRIIATIYSNGSDPVLNTVFAKAWIDPAIQYADNNPYVQRHYDIVPNNNEANATGRVTLYFTQQEFDQFNLVVPQNQTLPLNGTDAIGKSRLRIYQYHGQSIDGTPASYQVAPVKVDPEDNDIVWNGQLQRWEVTFNVEGFSGFFAGVDPPMILPVKLISFNGKINDTKTASLNWEITAPIAGTHYELQKSKDGNQFNTINTQTGNATTTQFNYADNVSSDQLNYYRLKIIDANGQTSYSQIVLLSMQSLIANKIILYPNPVNKGGQLQVSVSNGTLKQYQLTTASGQVLLQKGNLNIIGSTTIQLPAILAAGIYYLQLKTDNGMSNERVIIK